MNNEEILRRAGGGVVQLDERVRRSVVRALAGEPLPGTLRMALVELGVAQYRSAMAAERYRARAHAAISDPEEREGSIAECVRWPEFVERRDARESLRAVSERTAVLARVWIEGGAERVEVAETFDEEVRADEEGGEPLFVGGVL